MGQLFSKNKKSKKGKDKPLPAGQSSSAPSGGPAAAAVAPATVDANSVIPEACREPVTNEYKIEEELGRGGFAIVHRATRASDGQAVAIKFVDKKQVSSNPEDLQCLRREIDIMTKLDHANVLKLYKVFETPDQVVMVMELVRGGELFYKIVDRGSFSESEAANVVRQLVTGISYLHAQKVAHRDLKPENLLCAGSDANIVIKIADFGLSKAFTTGDPLKTACGTPDYAAPEVLSNEGSYSPAVDLWAVGVITYVLLCGYPPFYAPSLVDLFDVIKKGKYDYPPDEWSKISDDAKDFIQQLLLVNPTMRMTAEQCLNHPWLKTEVALKHTTTVMNLAKLREYNVKRKKETGR